MKSLEKQFRTSVDVTAEAIEAFNWESNVHYAGWLRQTIGMVRHTTRLLCLAAGNTPMSSRDAHYYWIEHLRGELHHDLVAIKDLTALGYNENDIPLQKSAEEIVLNQYRWIQEHDPISLNGYALLLEGLACDVAPRVITRLEAVHSKDKMKFLNLHAKVDQDHFAEGLEFIRSITPAQAALVQENLLQTQNLYIAFLSEVSAWADRQADKGSGRLKRAA